MKVISIQEKRSSAIVEVDRGEFQFLTGGLPLWSNYSNDPQAEKDQVIDLEKNIERFKALNQIIYSRKQIAYEMNMIGEALSKLDWLFKTDSALRGGKGEK